MADDFRSVGLDPPFRNRGRVFRPIVWSERLRHNGRLVHRDPIPYQNEVAGPSDTVIQNPLRMDGRTFPFFEGLLYWDRDGNFRGFWPWPSTPLSLTLSQQVRIIDYADQCMGLHNFKL